MTEHKSHLTFFELKQSECDIECILQNCTNSSSHLHSIFINEFDKDFGHKFESNE
jgi:hypothetical protein